MIKLVMIGKWEVACKWEVYCLYILHLQQSCNTTVQNSKGVLCLAREAHLGSNESAAHIMMAARELTMPLLYITLFNGIIG